MQVDLFGKLISDTVQMRALGFYQPFATLMLHGKIETRWVIAGHKPPFPLGKYLFYSTKKACSVLQLQDWAGGKDMVQHIQETTYGDPSLELDGYALGTGELVRLAPMLRHEQDQAFVKWIGTQTKDGRVRTQWALYFENVQAIDPFKWELGGHSLGAQAVSIVPECLLNKIKIV